MINGAAAAATGINRLTCHHMHWSFNFPISYIINHHLVDYVRMLFVIVLHEGFSVASSSVSLESSESRIMSSR